jgi:hypothetical protein
MDYETPLEYYTSFVKEFKKCNCNINKDLLVAALECFRDWIMRKWDDYIMGWVDTYELCFLEIESAIDEAIMRLNDVGKLYFLVSEEGILEAYYSE